MRKLLDGIQIVVNGCEDMQDKEIRAYVNKVRPEKGVVLKKLIITIMPGDPDNVVLIVPPKTPEQIQAETMQMMSSMLAEMKSMKIEMEELKNERRNSSAAVRNEPAEYAETNSGVGAGAESLAGSKQSSRSKKSD